MMQCIVDDDSEACPGEENLAALTASDRTSWATVREQFFHKGVNRESMEIIEKVGGSLIPFLCPHSVPNVGPNSIPITSL